MIIKATQIPNDGGFLLCTRVRSQQGQEPSHRTWFPQSLGLGLR
jgi:hypothetical protein